MAKRITEKVLVQRVLQIINEGKRETTYKFALLLALIDWCTSNSTNRIPTRDLAQRVLELYWNQVRPYHSHEGGGDTIVLKQGKKPLILSAVTELRQASPHKTILTWVTRANVPEYQRAVQTIDRVLADQVIPRLQTVGGQKTPFLYDVRWKPRKGAAEVAKGNSHLDLLPGVRDCLATLGVRLRPVIERAWVSDIIERNDLNSEEPFVHQHLFGNEEPLSDRHVRKRLAKRQGGVCFYCKTRQISASQNYIDYFIPWSKCPINAITNLVMACERCKFSKADNLAAPDLVKRWLTQTSTDWSALRLMALHRPYQVDVDRTIRLARGLYNSLADGDLLWQSNRTLTQLTAVHKRQLQAHFRAKLEIVQK